MRLLEVKDSSNIKGIGYENKTLFIQYSGGIYAYHDVPVEVVANFMQASSMGQFANEFIKGKYMYTKVGV